MHGQGGGGKGSATTAEGRSSRQGRIEMWSESSPGDVCIPMEQCGKVLHYVTLKDKKSENNKEDRLSYRI